MFWSVRGANAITALRCCRLADRFDDYWESRPPRRLSVTNLSRTRARGDSGRLCGGASPFQLRGRAIAGSPAACWLKNHCTAVLKESTLEGPERRIGRCGDATRAPAQRPECAEVERSVSAGLHSGGKAINPGGLGGGAPNSTTRWAATSSSSPAVVLELGRRHIPESRVQPLLVIDAL
jgi:hypothetical protein